MNLENLLRLLHTRPFEPFRLFMTDGSTFDIVHPDLIIPTRRTAIIGFAGQPGQGYAERVVTITLLHIVRVELLEQSQTGGQTT